MKKVFTTGQVAKICKVAPRTVSKWFDSGRLRGYRIPGSQDRRIPREQLIRFLKEHGMPLGELEEEEWHKVLAHRHREAVHRPPQGAAARETTTTSTSSPTAASRPASRPSSFHPDTIVIDLGLGRSEAIQIAAEPAQERGLRGDADRRPGQRGRGRPGEADRVRLQRHLQEAVRRGPARREDPEHRRRQAGGLRRDRQRFELPAALTAWAFPRARRVDARCWPTGATA